MECEDFKDSGNFIGWGEEDFHTWKGNMVLDTFLLHAHIDAPDMSMPAKEGKCNLEGTDGDIVQGKAFGTFLVAIPTCGTMKWSPDNVEVQVIGIQALVSFGFIASYKGALLVCTDFPLLTVSGYGDFLLP